MQEVEPRELASASTFWTLSFADWLALAGLVVAVAGFSVTIWQLVRTARASEATVEAIQKTEERLALNYLLVLLPQFRIVETDLDSAALADDKALAMRALLAYTHIASEVSSLLDGREDVDADLISRLQITAQSASATKADLVNNPNRATKTTTKQFRTDLTEVSSYLGGLTGRLRLGGASA